jgi:hypothetical protein
MATKHFIFDYETLGQNTMTCPIIDCAYYMFDIDRFLSDEPYTFEELINVIEHDKVSVEDQTSNYGFKIEKQTVEWWSQQGAAARAKIKPLPTDLSLSTHANNFHNYITKNGPVKYWWSRSNTFDPVIAWRIAKALNLDKWYDTNLPFWLVRDTRTYIDAKTNFAKGMNSFVPAKDEAKWRASFQQHNCVHDVAADILRLQALNRFENDLSIPD